MDDDFILSAAMLEHLSKMTPGEVFAAEALMRNPHQRSLSCEVIPRLPTLTKGHTDNLKLEWRAGEGETLGDYRYLVSRMTKEDGAKCDHEVVLEHRYVNGFRNKWGWRAFSHGPSKEGSCL